MSDPTSRKTPPETEDEWGHIWNAVKFANDARPVLMPVVALVKNTKAWVAMILFVVWINNPKIIEALKTLSGIDK